MPERENAEYLHELIRQMDMDTAVRHPTVEDTYTNGLPRKDRMITLRFPKRKKNRDKVLEEKIEGYIDAFTVHGLTRVFKAPKREAILWMVVLCLGIFLATVVLYKLLSKYFKYETYTEIRSVVTDKNYFPSLSICDLNLLRYQYFSYCGQSLARQPQGDRSKPCNYSSMPGTLDNVTMIDDKQWSNGVFEVIECSTWEPKDCNSKRFWRSNINLNNSCMTLNYKGDMTDTYGHIDITFKVNPPFKGVEPVIIATPHDPKIIEIDLTKKVNIDAHKLYEIKLVKTEVIRLPTPYPSNCTLEEEASHLDILPGAFSRRTCVESFKMLNAYKECGDTFDYVRPFIPDDIKMKYSKNLSIADTVACIRKAVQREPGKGSCPFPCQELDLGISSTYNDNRYEERDQKEWIYNIALQFQNVDYYKIMEEKALYSGNQLTCELGGFLGLVMGASLLSFVEILVCGFLYIMKRVYRGKKEEDYI